MQRWIPAVVALALAAVPLVGLEEAEPRPPADLPSADEMAARLSAGLEQNLGLTEEQKPRVREALLAMMQRQREILARQEREEPSPSAMRALLREIEASQAGTKAALQDVLSEEQLAGFDRALLDQRTEAVGEGMARRLEEPLGLTPEQRDQIAPIFAEHARAQAEAVAAARSGGRQFGSFRAARERATALQQDLERDLSRVLSAEQLARYREIAAEIRRARGRERSAADPR